MVAVGIDAGTYSSRTKVLMLKPRVGLTDMTSSFLSRLRMVVLPALSKPLTVSYKQQRVSLYSVNVRLTGTGRAFRVTWPYFSVL